MALVREMPVNAAAALLGEHDTRIWRVLDHYVQSARAQADHSEVRRVGIDETSARRGQDYVTLCFDLDQRRLLFGTPGKDHETVKAFTEDLKAHNGAPENVTAACIDMSKAFVKGISEALPNAEITFDPFHLIQSMNDALGKVRAEEARLFPEPFEGEPLCFLEKPGKPNRETGRDLGQAQPLPTQDSQSLSDQAGPPECLLRPHPRGWRSTPQELVQLGNPQSDRTSKEGREDCQEPLERNPHMVRQQAFHWIP